MRRVHLGPSTGLTGQLALLLALALTTGLSWGGWLAGVAAGLVTAVLLALGLRRPPREPESRLGPADRVTLLRAVLGGGVAALVVTSFTQDISVATLVVLSAVGLVLDAVDGWVARRTRTASSLGARFDMEVDAFLILALSAYAVPVLGWWVLAIGAARYLFLGATLVWPWLRADLPPRYWAKVVAATQGVVLTLVAADVLPLMVERAATVVALVLLAESFGRQVLDLRRLAGLPRRGLVTGLVSAASVVALWIALALPNRQEQLTTARFLVVPVEALVLVVLLVLLGRRVGRVVAAVAGLWVALLVLLKVFDIGFYAVFDRPFDPVNDWAYLGPGIGVLGDQTGNLVARLLAVGAGVLAVAVLVLLPLCAVRLASVVRRHRTTAARTVGVLGLVWVLFAVFGVQLVPGDQVASTSASAMSQDEVSRLRGDIKDRKVFRGEIATDAYAATPSNQLLTGLKGKDVLLLFVESYGRVAVQGTSFSPGVDKVLDQGTRTLDAAGFGSRSAFLTSPTFGAGSWLAHSSLESGLWVDSQQRYDELLTEKRLTLTRAFGNAGWRTVFDVPADTKAWPEGQRFYGFQKYYDSHNVGYKGPAFSYATMPDQYVLSAFRQRELASSKPVMAEIDLVSSHHPWTPLPHLVPWSQVGDGSVFDPMPAQGETPDQAFRSDAKVKALYGQSIEYTMSSIVSFVKTYPDPNLVLVVLGDHQPHSYVSGTHPGHDVPISVIAHDPKVLQAIGGWGWQSGIHPSPSAPVWRMDTFRDKFLAAYSKP